MKLKKLIVYTSGLLVTGMLGGFLLTGCNNANKNTTNSIAADSIYRAGQLKPSDTIIKHTFYIKNTGTANLVIDSVAGSCSCVAINWEKKPVKPGDSGFINVTVQSDTSDRKGHKMQQVVVKTNATKPFSVFQIHYTR
ncbi:DUF1573 domain-containing protein [Mucilaginibacter mali]|uniref:DUF1573 domain-containing protein n=1 Tax=Mucilaginibacter mali TaxID=2740462 RepID=A0A7D4QQH7_9SPHI|nr:DUF1573 domain-containing protein [Mucilaginibacter mali]QKJ29089.1 DUF1573 domain-containing protein [Mucilaginibacter mali]